MTRAEKIKFLQDLQRKRISPADLAPKRLVQMAGYGKDGIGSLFLINDIEVTEAEFIEAAIWQPGYCMELGYGPEIENDFGL